MILICSALTDLKLRRTLWTTPCRPSIHCTVLFTPPPPRRQSYKRVMMEREEEENAALRLTLCHLTSCGAVLANLPPQCLLSVNYARQGLEPRLPASDRKRAAKRRPAPAAAAAEKHCQFCCQKRDVKHDAVKVSRGGSGAERPHRVTIRCGFCRRAYVEEDFKMVVKVRVTYYCKVGRYPFLKPIKKHNISD